MSDVLWTYVSPIFLILFSFIYFVHKEFPYDG